MLILYTALLYLLQPAIWLYLWIRGRKSSSYRQRLAERYGFCIGKVNPYGILLHAVSLGETVAAIPLIRELQQRYPHLPIVVTTMTPTGSKFAQHIFGTTVSHVYLPYDLPKAMKRFLNTTYPKLVIIMETELWPNMITLLHARNIPLIIANARLSERSAKGYRIFGRFMAMLLQRITLIAVQNQADSQRFLRLGVKHSQIVVTGSLKFEINVIPELLEHATRLRREWVRHTRPIWIAASTHKGEEKIVLDAHCQLLKSFPDLLLIIVPRHPERYKTICKLTQKHNLEYLVRSSKKTPSLNIQVVIEDSVGELRLLYAISDLAFVGGSLVEHGGHNPLEPAAHAIPILMGPHTFNFTEICHHLKQAHGLMSITDAKSLHQEINTLLTNSNYRLHCGQQAWNVLNQHKGALKHLLNVLNPYLTKRKNHNECTTKTFSSHDN
ncbi:lipid IV(A) 3-deoxy-D-manno-octulosonic acid transferase [Candidatus Erwinia haradaeae]|uniref:3-deoxy-D-manno-octulosonic acid transferase n=1 Tax=Candidatus Erwinia haradaeae TaxID=1922217 RepID=A0A451D9H0_9GAMM|nr:lipid IV(A) 3-deoxy-D-manno-octulosonic acid transferase [Candidatus Erwinia haradaeae]VFP82912.1 3-deoxy-D-manno-octulosonic acid transferase [Candidatus Erwinia haradaeae]